MKKKKVLWIAAFSIILIILYLFYIFFDKNKLENQGNDRKEHKKVITMIVPYLSIEHNDFFKQLCKQYERIHKDIEVKIEYISRENYKKEICLKQDEKETVDIIICDRSIMLPLIQMNMFQPFPIDQWKNKIQNDFLLESVMYHGKYYGLPLTIDPYVLFYNMQMLSSFNKLPNKWSTIVEQCRHRKSAGRYFFAFPSGQADETAKLCLLLLSTQGGILNGSSEEKYEQVYRTLQELYQEKAIPPNMMNMNSNDLCKEFLWGNVGMMLNRYSVLQKIKEEKLNFKMKIQPLSSEISDCYFFTGDNIGLSIGASEEAKEFLNYLLSEEQYSKFCKEMGVFSVWEQRNSTIKEWNWLDMQSKNLPVHEVWFDISDILAESVYECFQTDAKPPKEMSKNTMDFVKTAIFER